jgi:hypothetical protein
MNQKTQNHKMAQSQQVSKYKKIVDTYKKTVEASKVRIPEEYKLDTKGRFQIKNYNQQPAFASFLPGIGGCDGVPLWCLYVNRGQAISSFGIGNKDNPVMEFLPANWAYQLTGIQGFRTFCKVNGQYYEPFQNDLNAAKHKLQRTMSIEMDRLVITEENKTIGLKFEVTYFSPVNKPVGSLARILKVTNTSSGDMRIDGLDGLPVVMPAGFTDIGIKTMRRIHEAYACVRIVDGNVPFYAAKVLTHDQAEVEEVKKGNFYASWLSDGDKLLPIQPYFDPDLIFGGGQDLVTPRGFIDNILLNRNTQVAENKLACAMTPFKVKLESKETMTLVALSGMAPNDSMLVSFLSDFKKISDIEQESVNSRQLINSITQPAFAVSSNPKLDGYTRQNYLDNILRGGIPKLMPSKSGPALLHLYSRRHGDAERDYNFFDLPASPLSSGEGNYRDICQNRRSDIWFYPEVWDREIKMFTSLLQADGYNPLAIKGNRWCLSDDTDPMKFCPTKQPEAKVAFKKLLDKPFLPGEVLSWSDYYNIKIPDRDKWLDKLLNNCQTNLIASGHEGGYWIDHWIYILDLLEAFNAIYPDKTEQILTEQADIDWFFESANVVERKKKYLKRKNGPLQLDAVIDANEKIVDLPPVTVLGKLCGLLAIKAVSLDYEGRGIEMEAGRPGWNDAMNGLPGLFGSSTCEAVETLRLAKWLLEILDQMPAVDLPVEVANLIENVCEDLNSEYNWDRSTKVREEFRKKIYTNSSDKLTTVSGAKLKQLLVGIVARFDDALNSSIDPESGLMHTYYSHKPLDAKDQKADDSECVDIKKFQAEPLPLFIEGQVHWLRVCSKDQARNIYHAVQNSPLLDEKLQMYKLNECLHSCPPEIGRARTFSRGWFENESIWLHMSYKYLLELLRAGAHEEFFKDAETMLVPFMDPQVYGRSILENSSFIASSACPDPAARGRGFVARLSGSTAEFIHIWLLMTTGPKPFFQEKGELNFKLAPALPGSWFTDQEKSVDFNGQTEIIPQGSFACALLGTTLLVYHNESGRDTYGDSAVKPVRYLFDKQTEINATHIGPEIAENIRLRNYKRIDVWLK